MNRMTQKPTPSKSVDADTQTLPLLRIEDLAARLSVSRSFAWKLVAAGQIRSVRIGRAVRVRQIDLDAFLADSAREG